MNQTDEMVTTNVVNELHNNQLSARVNVTSSVNNCREQVLSTSFSYVGA